MRIAASEHTGLAFGRRQNALIAPETAAAPVRSGLPAVVRHRASESRALAPRHRPVSALIAQLIAGAEDLPSSRVRRRADPGVGMDAYQAAARLGPVPLPGKSRFI
jgi:hypothetical protein